jgi:CheY-like chemotaxis protein
MNAVLGYAHLLGKHDNDAKEKEELLNQIISSARNITLLIDDLVNTTLIVNNQISIICNDFNINVILNNLKSFYSKKIEMVYNNQINIIVEEIEDDKALVYIDSGRIEQILRYVLSLAILKTVPGDIIFGASINNENELKFYTTFFAPDFPDNIIENINDSIDFAVEILDTALGKEFMGLKIANGLVNLMDGKIDIRKTSKGKVTIWFNIPIPKGKLASHSPDIGNEYIWKNKVILIAEDEQENTLLFQELFKDTDAHLIFAETGEQIIDLFETLSHIDLILLDIKLPVMNGDDVARYIRGTGSKIPLIAQTAYSYPSTKESLLEAGFNEYFCKPINVRDLMETMNKYLLESPSSLLHL